MRTASPGVVFITALAIFLFFGLAVLSWGDLDSFVANPFRPLSFVVIGVAAVASLFTGINLGGCVRADARERWMLAPLVVLSLGIAALPPYAEQRNWLTLPGGNLTRSLGLFAMALGAFFRVGPMFVLGRRFTWPLAGQEQHQLVKRGFYRYVRHPSYAGAFIGAVGWALIFRSGLGLILVALLLPAFLPVLFEEEGWLQKEFGDEYLAYQRQTWRLFPFLF